MLTTYYMLLYSNFTSGWKSVNVQYLFSYSAVKLPCLLCAMVEDLLISRTMAADVLHPDRCSDCVCLKRDLLPCTCSLTCVTQWQSKMQSFQWKGKYFTIKTMFSLSKQHQVSHYFIFCKRMSWTLAFKLWFCQYPSEQALFFFVCFDFFLQGIFFFFWPRVSQQRQTRERQQASSLSGKSAWHLCSPPNPHFHWDAY